MDIKTFVNITSRAWAMPILAQLHMGTPGRQAPLLAATGASRTAFSQSMEHLISIGLLERNPGYGHPLRPEFRLTEFGKHAAKIADQINQVTSKEDWELLRRSWTLPVLTSLNAPCHFTDIKRTLPTITDRALSISLQRMEYKGWVSRNVLPTARPPRSEYVAISKGEEISQLVASEVVFPTL